MLIFMKNITPLLDFESREPLREERNQKVNKLFHVMNDTLCHNNDYDYYSIDCMVHDYGEELEILTHVIEQTFNARIGVVLDCWLEKVRSGVGSLLVCVLFFWATLFSSS